MKAFAALLLACLLLLCGCSGAAPSLPGSGAWNGTQEDGVLLEDPYSGETYLPIEENAAISAAQQAELAFSLKVDTAAYANVTRYLESGNLPPADAVRTEELLNYFRYEAEMPASDAPFSVYTELGPSPFDREKRLAFIRVKTPEIDKSELPPSNLTFLIDTSGSMDSYDKLPLLKTAFSLLVETLTENDRVSIVTYAGSSQVVLDGASGADKAAILDAIYSLSAGGSTAGADGIRTAYALAEKNLRPGGNNRVILATDGDFNVGISDTRELGGFIAEKRDGGVYLSLLGFGTGNLRDDVLETLSKNGNGNYSYIESVQTAKKVLVEELGGNLFTVANDVKAQVAFNPDAVESYRLIGYENRLLSEEEFQNDQTDAGEIGAGTDMVILFELTMREEAADAPFEVRIRYKLPGESESREVVKTGLDRADGDQAGTDLGFASSVAVFGHLLRQSPYTGEADIQTALSLAQDNLGRDPGGYRQGYVALLKAYQRLAG